MIRSLFIDPSLVLRGALTPHGSRMRAQLLRRMSGASRPLSRLSRAQQRTLVTLLEALVDEPSASR
jgi:hypothetical protein